MKAKIESITLIIIIFIIIFITIGVLSKKNDYTEITENAYVSSMGIDYNIDSNSYTVYLYILNNFNLSISDYGLSEANKLGYICKETGISIPDALSKINKQSNIRLQYSHIRSVLLKESFFNKNNVLNFYNHIRLSLDIYPNFSIYTTSDDLMEIYNVKNFSDTSGYYTILVNTDSINKPKNSTFLNFANDILCSTYTVAYPIIKICQENFYENNESLTSLDISGYSFITDDYTLSSFSFENLRGLNHLNRFSKNVLSFEEFDYLVNEFTFKKKLINGKLQLHMLLRGAFIGNKKNYDNDTLTKMLISHIKADMHQLKDTMDNYYIDVFNIDFITKNKQSFLNTNIDVIVKVI